MSKTSQRFDTFYQQGYNDFVKKRDFRWKSHPYLGAYTAGWNQAKQEWATDEVKKTPPWWHSWLHKVGIYV